MATLEKIRSKSVFLIVIIAVALLAFILGDLITNGRNLFGNNTTVGKIDGQKIEYNEYQRKIQELEPLLAQNPNFDSQEIGHLALQQLMIEKLMDQGVTNLGIKPSAALLQFYMIENPQEMYRDRPDLVSKLYEIYQMAGQYAQQKGIAINGGADLYKIIFSPRSVGLTEAQVAPLQQAWVALEAQYQTAIAQKIYTELLMSSRKANDADKAVMKKIYAQKADAQVAKKPYGQIDEKKYPVSDAEIQKLYNERKEKYAIKFPTKDLGFIAVSVAPSSKDLEDATKLANSAIIDLRTNGRLTQDSKNAGLKTTKHRETLDNIKDETLKVFLTTASKDTVSLLQSNQQGFLIAKFNGKSSTDSVKLNLVEIEKGKMDEVIASLNAGTSLDSIKVKYTARPDEVSVTISERNGVSTLQDLPRIYGSVMSDSVGSKLLANRGKYIEVETLDNTAVIGSLSPNSQTYDVYDFETVDYRIIPSENTLAEATKKLEKFLATNNTAAKFMANAKKSGYNLVDVEVSSQTAAIPQGMNPFTGQKVYYPDSRAVVRWAMIDGKDGEVSHIFENKDVNNPMIYAAAVVKTYEEYAPWNQKSVKEELTAEIRRKKAAADMIKQYSGKGDINATAAAMGVEIENAGVGLELPSSIKDKAVVAKVLASKPSQTVQIFEGNDGIYAVVVDKVTNETQLNDQDAANKFLMLHNSDFVDLLMGKKKIENNIFNFMPAE